MKYALSETRRQVFSRRGAYDLQWFISASRFQPLVRCLTSCDEERFRSLLENFQGGSVDLKKNEENGIATLLVNNPTKKNAFTGKFKHEFTIT